MLPPGISGWLALAWFGTILVLAVLWSANPSGGKQAR
jgi:preprotein translocase subunit SecG